ncbi:hypothetical protein [Mariniradius sediminis]|uniref:ABC-type transport system involved in multi-copper enzyme maturation, permease component n=1 Tax=Mariniradius sediminis TaxID=2909237 RepID=A0ABS9BR83_9BACT|nr:hypothetical protein [Mariniradius sediminis]MCF1750542.1 hypothetical protein [Mariniradius sediminis]
MEEKPIKKQQDLTWLENLQKNSWEPEVIISGIILAFLFVIPSRFFELSVVLIQDYGLEHIPADLVFVYFSAIISFFKIFLVSHLVLRFLWAGMLGISYAFPEGVKKENLFKNSQNIDYKHPTYYLIKLEAWCSMAYGLPISVVVPLVFITLYLILLIGIYLVFDLNFEVVYVIFMVTLILFAVLSLAFKKSAVRDYIGSSMNGTVSAIYQSNLGKWAFMLYTGVLVVLSLPLIYYDIRGFSQYRNEVNLEEADYNWPQESQYFEKYNTSGRRFGRAWTTTNLVGSSHMVLNLAYYERDAKDLPRMNELLQGEQDTLPWKEVNEIPQLYRVYLNDSLLQDLDWQSITSGMTGQRAFSTNLPMEDLPDGKHEIRIEKLVYLPPFLGMGSELRHREKWARFVFLKVDD